MAVSDSVKAFVKEHDKIIKDAQEHCIYVCSEAQNHSATYASMKVYVNSTGDYTAIKNFDCTLNSVRSDIARKAYGAQEIMDTCMGEASVEIEKVLKQNKEENYESVKYLLETMKRWRNEYSNFKTIEVPVFGWSFPISAPEEVDALIRGNEEIFKDDPVMKIVEIKIRRHELLEGLKRAKELVVTKKAELNAVESKYQELTSNYDAHLQKAVEEAKNESIALGESIVSEERTLGNMEDDLRRLSSELNSSGFFSSSKKKLTEVLVAEKKEQIEKKKRK